MWGIKCDDYPISSRECTIRTNRRERGLFVKKNDSHLALIMLSVIDSSLYAEYAENPSTKSVVNSDAPKDSHSIAVTPTYPRTTPAKGMKPELIKRGEYLAKMGDCIACHTD